MPSHRASPLGGTCTARLNTLKKGVCRLARTDTPWQPAFSLRRVSGTPRVAAATCPAQQRGSGDTLLATPPEALTAQTNSHRWHSPTLRKAGNAEPRPQRQPVSGTPGRRFRVCGEAGQATREKQPRRGGQREAACWGGVKAGPDWSKHNLSKWGGFGRCACPRFGEPANPLQAQ